ncbi:MAG: FAD-dependent oxidoreductase, partial [Pseudomonadota bacterium]|nr:FAD-dependent oxidoreductase [Pseudomonadota bacterium]
MADTDFDLIVIGGGPGGYVAAIRAAQLGMKAAVVEREHLGGICLNWGCIPTKAMLRSSEVLHLAQHAADFGLEISGAVAHLDKIVARSRAIAKQLSGGVAHLLKKNKVAVFNGSGRLDGTAGARRKVKVAAGDKTVADLTAAHVILASGARARTLPGIEADGKTVWTYKDALVPGQKPASMLVIGSGAIGVEFASFYNDISVDVTIVEVVDRILPAEDGEVSAFAQKAFEKQGIKILTAAQVTGVKKTAAGARVTISAGGRESQLDVEVVLLSVGIVGNIEDLGLDG